MLPVLCPNCGKELNTEAHSLRCENGHCFDIARQGYVNLLPVTQKHSKAPGDTAAQVAARRTFLQSGTYEPIAKTLAELAGMHPHDAVLDVGCGEGYYLEQLTSRLSVSDAVGIDISKDAVRYAAVRLKAARFFTATASHLPFADASFDLLTSMFALTLPGEFARVLKPGGIFLQVTAAPHHLWGLKGIIYPTLFEKEESELLPLPGFALEQEKMLEFPIRLEGNDMVLALLGMTPHIMRINEAGMERARAAERLDDTARVCFRVYRKTEEKL